MASSAGAQPYILEQDPDQTSQHIDMIKAHLNSLRNNPAALEGLKTQELADMVKRMTPSGVLASSTSAQQSKYSIIGMEHTSRVVMCNEIMVAAMGYLHQSVRNYEVALDREELEREWIAKNPNKPRENHFSEIDAYYAKRVKEETALALPYVQAFVNRYFRFNPDQHVRKIGEFEIEGVEIPAEPFQAFDHYLRVHHENVSRIVCEKILKHSLNISDTVFVAASGLTEAEADLKFNALKNTTLLPIYKIKEGVAVLIGDKREIRRTQDLTNADQMSRVLGRVEEDQKLARDILRKRVKSTKLTNYMRHGLDDPEFKKYVQDLNPERNPEEIFTKEELEEINAKYKAKMMKEQEERIIAEAPPGTKIIPFNNIDPDNPEDPIEQYVIYSEIDHFLQIPEQ
jgi:hypothetical protein